MYSFLHVKRIQFFQCVMESCAVRLGLHCINDNSLILLPLKSKGELKECLEGVVKFFTTSISLSIALY